MLKCDSSNVQCKFGARQKWKPAGYLNIDFGNNFEQFCQKRWIDRPECYLSWKIVKYCILSEVCMINSTVSPQMWCIKSIKGWFTHPQIHWQEFEVKFVNLSKAKKILPDLFSKNLFSRPNLLWSRAIMALERDRRWLLFLGVHIRLSSRC